MSSEPIFEPVGSSDDDEPHAWVEAEISELEGHGKKVFRAGLAAFALVGTALLYASHIPEAYWTFLGVTSPSPWVALLLGIPGAGLGVWAAAEITFAYQERHDWTGP